MAASLVSLKSVFPCPSSSGLWKMLLQMKKIGVRILFFRCAVYHTVEEMLNSTVSQLQSEVRQHKESALC